MGKDALGHGSNSRGIATAAGYNVVQKPPLGHFIKSPTGEEHGPYFGARGAWKDAARLATVPRYADDLGAAKMLASGPKSAAAPVHDSMSTDQWGTHNAMYGKRASDDVASTRESNGRHGYNAAAVNDAIASSNRSGRRIGGKEASAIHRLLKGR